MKHNKSLLKWLALSLLVIVVDQISKYWAEHHLQGNVVPVFSWFDFSLAHNTGAAFSFLANAGGWQQVFFIVLAVLVSVVLITMIKQLHLNQRHLAVAYALIIGGALGNVIDRLVYQYVIDFIHWYYHDWHWPHFNVADIAICIGAGLLIAEALGLAFLNCEDKDENITG